MKLFQQMLVAGATMSLLAPMAVQASEYVNLEEINSYSRSDSKTARFDNKTFINSTNEDKADINSIDVLQGIEAGGFSDTTVLDGKAIFAVGAIDGNDTLDDGEALTTPYVYQMNLNTSFTGDDNLYVRLKTGAGWTDWINKPLYHIEGTSYTDTVAVDKIWYTFPLGDSFTATIGPKIENYYMLAATPSVYKPGALKAFKLGSHSSAFGASTSTGAGITYKADNGFASSVTVNSKLAKSSTGLFTNDDQTKINVQTAYTADNYHVSATYSKQRGWNSWSYYSTKDLSNGAGTTGANATKSDSLALRAWWRPEETGTATPSISVGYDIIDFGLTHDNGVAEGSGYFVGLNWADMFQPEDKVGLAVGQPMKATAATAGNTLTEVDPFIWEFYYSFRPNDSIEVTPAIFGGTDVWENDDEDMFGAVVTTTFKF